LHDGETLTDGDVGEWLTVGVFQRVLTLDNFAPAGHRGDFGDVHAGELGVDQRLAGGAGSTDVGAEGFVGVGVRCFDDCCGHEDSRGRNGERRGWLKPGV
jgi:hypothetical protein